jgi:hypothetical protein
LQINAHYPASRSTYRYEHLNGFHTQHVCIPTVKWEFRPIIIYPFPQSVRVRVTRKEKLWEHFTETNKISAFGISGNTALKHSEPAVITHIQICSFSHHLYVSILPEVQWTERKATTNPLSAPKNACSFTPMPFLRLHDMVLGREGISFVYHHLTCQS